MIAISLPGYPEKHRTAELTVNPAGGWDLDVYDLAGGGWRVRDPRACREGISREEMIDVLFTHGNGEADELLNALGLAGLAVEGWRRHLARAEAWRRAGARPGTREPSRGP